MRQAFNLPDSCTLRDISGPEPLICDECGEEFYGESPREIGDVVRCEECEGKEEELTRKSSQSGNGRNRERNHSNR